MRFPITVLLASLFAPLFAEMEPATPESQGVDSKGILAFIDAAEKTFDGSDKGRLHGFVIVRHGKTIAEGSWKPFDTLNETHMLYSHSKSFTSTAIGFLVDDGELDLDERVADIFPESLPENPAPGITEIRVRDLLTMNVGSDLNHDVANGEDWIKRFFTRKLDRKPGTGFKYDSDATYMLAAIVEKRTGKKLMEFLQERLFSKIGIEKAWTRTSPQGIACGGWGMNMTTRELARFGQFYLQKGMWNGERLLSPEWIRLATTRQTWCNGIKIAKRTIGSGSDWNQGYGFQFWCCRHGAYRADGAAGQLTVVLPEQDAVVSIHAGLGDMQRELKLVWDHLLPAMKDGALPENKEGQEELKARCNSLSIPAVAPDSYPPGDKLYGDYAIAPNRRGIRAVRILPDADGWKMEFYARCWPTEFPVGCGEWKTGTLNFDPDPYEGLGTLQWNMKTAASAAFDKDGALVCRVYMTGTTHWLDFKFFLKDGVPSVTGQLWGMGGTKFTGSKLTDAAVPELPRSEDKVAVRKFFTDHEFGVRPVERPKDLEFKVVAENECLGGRAVHRAVLISTNGKLAPFAFVAHLYEPKGAMQGKEHLPVMVAINLGQRLKAQDFKPAAEDPSIPSWPIKDVIDRGFATIGFSNWDVASDGGDCFASGVFKAFGPETRAPDSWGALSAWAWGASRCVDFLETQPEFALRRVGVIGHSRGGKTALWAGVTDERFSLVCVNNSGAGGAKLNRMTLPWSESLDAIYNVFPHWFAPNYRRFIKDDGASMPYDQHDLLSLVAPRKLVVGSATEDAWAGPQGEEAAAKAVGAKHFWREGGHDLTPSDWAHYLDNL